MVGLGWLNELVALKTTPTPIKSPNSLLLISTNINHNREVGMLAVLGWRVRGSSDQTKALQGMTQWI